MAKEMILMEDVEGLGLEGDVVKVAEGYARNFLLPKKLAAPVTGATRKVLERKREQREADEVSALADAEALSVKLEKISCTIPVKSGEEGKLYGSVQAGDILSALKEQGVTLAKGQLQLEQPLRELGVFKVPVKLHSQVTATLKVWVVEE